MRKMYYLMACLILIGWQETLAQQVSGMVYSFEGKPLNNVTASLLNSSDSSVQKLSVSNVEGSYSFLGISQGNYIVKLSYVGMEDWYSMPFDVIQSDKVIEAATLKKSDANSLQGVTVTARKPLIEVKADKTILNVENSVNAVGQDALELLRKSPGVLVDRDENLSLSGKNGVQVYIDGKPSPLTGSDLSAYLKTIQSSQIEAIEIITNPSAKYDAAGNAGIINIRFKKNKSYGTNGSINAGYGIGIFSKYNAGISLNNRSKNLNLFGSYNYNNSLNESFMKLYRVSADTIFDQKSTMRNSNEGHSFKAGADYTINKSNTLGIMVNGSLNETDFSNNSRTPIIYQPDGKTDRLLRANNSSFGDRDNFNANINYRFADTAGHELNIDLDYGFYDIYTNQLQPNQYYTPDGQTSLYSRIYNFISPSKINIYSGKADYEQGWLKGKLGLGVKTSYVQTQNDFIRYDILDNSEKLEDSSRSNQFRYQENVNAGYVNYNRQFKGIMIQAGLRVENTVAEGLSDGYKWVDGKFIPADSVFTRNYTNLFPSASITFNKNPMNQWSVSYSRRIDRPAYQDLNPFEFKLDEYTYQRGNTRLTPQFTNSIGVTNTYKYRLTTTLNYSHVKDVFTQLVDTADISRSFISKQNLATQDIVSLNISFPFQYKWYSVFANLNSYYTMYQADFGSGRTINLDVFAFNFYSQHTFKIKDGLTGELSGWYASPSIWQGTFESKQMWSVDAGIQKQIFEKKGTIKLSVSDIFQTLRWKGESNFAGQLVVASGGWESRQFKVNFTYRFGKNSVKAARQRKTGTEDENQRVNSSGGGLGG